MLIKIKYPNYVSILISFMLCSWIVNTVGVRTKRNVLQFTKRVFESFIYHFYSWDCQAIWLYQVLLVWLIFRRGKLERVSFLFLSDFASNSFRHVFIFQKRGIYISNDCVSNPLSRQLIKVEN